MAETFWYAGLPFTGLASNNDAGTELYWREGLPEDAIFSSAALIGTFTGTSTFTGTLISTILPTATLIVEEGGVLTDRTDLLYIGGELGSPADFTLTKGQRGSARIPLILPYSNSYMPAIGSPVQLFDTSQRVFAGLIFDLQQVWIADYGYRLLTLNCVTLELIWEMFYVSYRVYENKSAGFIFTDLMTVLTDLGAPFTIGTVEDGPTIARFICNHERISDKVEELRAAASFITGVDPASVTAYFMSGTASAAPFTLTGDKMLWESAGYSQTLQDYRNNQRKRISFDGASVSADLLPGDGSTTQFTLSYLMDHVVSAQITTSVQATATGTFSGQPSFGDAVTINYIGTGTSGGGGGGGGSGTPATRYQFFLSSNGATHGVPWGFTVTAMDEFNNPLPSYLGTISFATDIPATVPSNYTFTGADAGTHAFSVTFTNASATGATVFVTDTVTGTTSNTYGYPVIVV